MVTVIMPAYNCKRYLEEAVESVKAQTSKDWKLLIIDDCSTDGTRELAEKLAKTDVRVKVLENDKNCGVSRTRNRGVQEADSKWIAFLDSDDVWREDKLEKQLELLSKVPDAKLVFTGSGFIRESGEKMSYELKVPERINRRELLKQNLISCSSALVERELLLRYPMPEKETMHEDYTVWLRILEEEKFAYGVNEPLLIYRKSSSSKSSNKLKAAIMNWNAYREVGLNPVISAYYMCWYTIRGVKKYARLE